MTVTFTIHDWGTTLIYQIRVPFHYFTIWGPRQTGKTWLMRQTKQEITQRYGEQFTVFNFSFLEKLSVTETVDGVTVSAVAVGWT